jgi:proliferating cell nuclear antigen
MKLMDIDSDALGIPDTDYDASVTMSSSEFTRIVRDLSQLGESVRIEVSKEGIRFASDGEAANGSVLLKQTAAAREKYQNRRASEDTKDEDDEEEGTSTKVKKEKVKKEADDVEMDDGDADGEEEFQAGSDEDEDDGKKKRKKSQSKVRGCDLLRYLF